MDAAIAVEKTSLSIDRDKLAEAQRVLGTATMAATVDAALWEVIRQDRKRRLIDRMRREGGIGPSPSELDELRST